MLHVLAVACVAVAADGEDPLEVPRREAPDACPSFRSYKSKTFKTNPKLSKSPKSPKAQALVSHERRRRCFERFPKETSVFSLSLEKGKLGSGNYLSPSRRGRSLPRPRLPATQLTGIEVRFFSRQSHYGTFPVSNWATMGEGFDFSKHRSAFGFPEPLSIRSYPREPL